MKFHCSSSCLPRAGVLKIGVSLNVQRSRLTPDRGLDLLRGHLLRGPDLLGGYGVPDPTNLHRHTYGVVLKHNSDWLTLRNVLNNMFHIRKLVSRHKNAHCSLDTYATFVWKYDAVWHAMMTSSNGNIFRVTAWPFVRGIHRSRWIPHTKASDAELWCFLWSASE